MSTGGLGAPEPGRRASMKHRAGVSAGTGQRERLPSGPAMAVRLRWRAFGFKIDGSFYLFWEAMNPSKRETVLDTAEHLFYEEGFHATGIDRVVAEAGVARMTLYNHFPSKEALVAAVLERRYRRYLAELRDGITARGHDSAAVALVQRHNDWLRTRSRSGCIVLKAIGEFERHRPAIAGRGRELKRELLNLIDEALSIDGCRGDAGLADRVMMVLEGANALAPVLGAERVAAHVESMLASVLGRTADRSQ